MTSVLSASLENPSLREFQRSHGSLPIESFEVSTYPNPGQLSLLPASPLSDFPRITNSNATNRIEQYVS